MIEVFRIEHRDTRIGPFQTPDPYLQELAKRVGKVSYLRNPYDDGLGIAWIPWFFVFGCPSIAALKQWIFLPGSSEANNVVVQEFVNRGFVVAEYLVEENNYRMGFSKLQVAFDADSSRYEGLVQYHDMGTLLSFVS